MSYVPMLRSSGGAALGDQGEDMDAIAQYMAATPARTAAAQKTQDDWKVWLDGLSWWNRNYDRPTYDHARNLRNAFDLANATTAAEQTSAQQKIKTGLTTEEMTGGPTRITSDGKFSEADGGVAPPMPLWGKFAIGIAVAGLGIYGLHELRLLSSIFKKAPKKSS